MSRGNNVRTALILALIAVALFFGVIVNRWLVGG